MTVAHTQLERWGVVVDVVVVVVLAVADIAYSGHGHDHDHGLLRLSRDCGSTT